MLPTTIHPSSVATAVSTCEPIDPQPRAFVERGGVDQHDVRGVALPASLGIANSVSVYGRRAPTRPPVAIDGGKAGGAVQAQIAVIVSWP